MKNIIKKLIATALTASMAVTTLAIPASAAWKTTDNGVQWTDSTGKPVKSKWITMKNGNKYYINSKGYRVTGLIALTQNKVKSYYYFDSKGVMQTGWQLINNKYYYFQKSGKAVLNKKITIGNYSYKFDSKGVWDKKVINAKTNKDVTKSVDISKLTDISASKTSSTKPTASASDLKTPEDYVKSLGKIPAYITICGTKVSTDVTIVKDVLWKSWDKSELERKRKDTYYKREYVARLEEEFKHTAYIDLSNATDKGLENLKYLTKLESLCLETSNSSSDKGTPIKITNLDFCRYMPNLKTVNIGNCPKLTDMSALQIFKTKFNSINVNYSNSVDISTLEGVKSAYISFVDFDNAGYWKLFNFSKASEIYFYTPFGAAENRTYVYITKKGSTFTKFVVQTEDDRNIVFNGNKVFSYTSESYTPKELVAAYPEMRQAVINAGFDI